MSSKFGYLLKYIIISDSRVGKTNILSVYNNGNCNDIWVEFIAKNKEIKFNISTSNMGYSSLRKFSFNDKSLL